MAVSLSLDRSRSLDVLSAVGVPLVCLLPVLPVLPTASIPVVHLRTILDRPGLPQQEIDCPLAIQQIPYPAELLFHAAVLLSWLSEGCRLPIHVPVCTCIVIAHG